jgi:hypothetical protein
MAGATWFWSAVMLGRVGMTAARVPYFRLRLAQYGVGRLSHTTYYPQTDSGAGSLPGGSPDGTHALMGR